jgi:hypothetical protein
MISDAATYVAGRITEAAAERLAPTIAWGAALVALALGAIAFALVAINAYLAPMYGQLQAAAMIASGCVAAAALLVIGRSVYRKISRHLSTRETSSEQAFEALDEEAHEAVDYFGSAKVIATAFMFGFSAARRVKH